VATRAILYDAEGRDREVPLEAGMADHLAERHLLWIDVDTRGAPDVAELERVLDLPSGVGEELRDPSERAVARHYPKAVHLTIFAVDDPGESEEPPKERAIDVWAGENHVVTVHDGAIDSFEAFIESVRGESRLGALSSADLMTALIDSVLNSYLRHVEVLERRVDELDERAIRQRESPRFLGEVVRVRRRVAALRRTLTPHREAFAPLSRADFHLPELGRPWPALLDRLELSIGAVENVRDLLIGTMDIYLSGLADRTNRVMQRLAVINAVLLPAIVLAGVMGMNFEIPFFDDPSNFAVVVVAMIVLGVASLLVARRWA
jgi:Mg2+ and Co2+ transporter CorA